MHSHTQTQCGALLPPCSRKAGLRCNVICCMLRWVLGALTLVERVREEVCQQHRISHVGQHAGVQAQEHLAVDVARYGQRQERQPCLAEDAPLCAHVGPHCTLLPSRRGTRHRGAARRYRCSLALAPGLGRFAPVSRCLDRTSLHRATCAPMQTQQARSAGCSREMWQPRWLGHGRRGQQASTHNGWQPHRLGQGCCGGRCDPYAGLHRPAALGACMRALPRALHARPRAPPTTSHAPPQAPPMALHAPPQAPPTTSALRSLWRLERCRLRRHSALGAPQGCRTGYARRLQLAACARPLQARPQPRSSPTLSPPLCGCALPARQRMQAKAAWPRRPILPRMARSPHGCERHAPHAPCRAPPAAYSNARRRGGSSV
eukprot:353182-Chlamydomonas_euryale.AAC.7